MGHGKGRPILGKTRRNIYVKQSVWNVITKIADEQTKKNKIFGKPSLTYSEVIEEAILKYSQDQLIAAAERLEEISEKINLLSEEQEEIRSRIRKLKEKREGDLTRTD